MEARLAAGHEGVDLDLYQRLANSLRRILETLGLDRAPKDVTPTSRSRAA